MSAFKLAKNVDERSKLLVFGYVRSVESALQLPNTPPLIMHLCLTFYYLNEYFARALRNCFVISDDKLTVTKIDEHPDWNHTICLNEEIQSMSNAIVTWQFKIIQRSVDEAFDGGNFIRTITMGFGILSNCSAIDKDIVYDDPAFIPHYVAYDGSLGWKFKNGIGAGKSNLRIVTDDIVTFVLDLKQQLFTFKINDEADQILFDNITISQDIKYTFGVQLNAKDDSVSLTNFSIF